MMAFRGVLLTYETVRNWCKKFGSSYAAVNIPILWDRQSGLHHCQGMTCLIPHWCDLFLNCGICADTVRSFSDSVDDLCSAFSTVSVSVNLSCRIK